MATNKFMAPSRGYLVSLKINKEDYDYGEDLETIRVSSSLATAWQIVTLFVKIPPQDIILKKLHGQDKIKLSIKLTAQGKSPLEVAKFDLMLLSSEFEMPVSDRSVQGKQIDIVLYKIITVTRTPFASMTTMVNSVFGVTSSPKTPKQIIQELISKNKIPLTLEYDSQGENTEKVPQVCVPPTSLYNAINFLDDSFGLFKGTFSAFCRYDNVLKIMNLSSRIKKSATITVDHLTLSAKEEEIKKSLKDKKYFYTYDNIYNSFVGNSKFGVIGNTIKRIVLPGDSLYYVITQDLSKICSDYGLIDGDKNLPIINEAINRTKYYIGDSGNDYSEVFAIAKTSKFVFNMSRVSFMVERNLLIENLLEVGDVVRLQSGVSEYKTIQGKYILFSSDLMWYKEKEWQTTGKLELVRTNKTTK